MDDRLWLEDHLAMVVGVVVGRLLEEEPPLSDRRRPPIVHLYRM